MPIETPPIEEEEKKEVQEPISCTNPESVDGVPKDKEMLGNLCPIEKNDITRTD